MLSDTREVIAAKHTKHKKEPQAFQHRGSFSVMGYAAMGYAPYPLGCPSMNFQAEAMMA